MQLQKGMVFWVSNLPCPVPNFYPCQNEGTKVSKGNTPAEIQDVKFGYSIQLQCITCDII